MDNYQAVIIGAGSAGMSYAALLAEHGKRVLIIDKRNYLGGRAATRKASEWGWDGGDWLVSYGPHILPARGYAELLLDILGVNKQPLLKKLNLPYIYKNGKIVEIPADFSKRFSFVKILRILRHIEVKEKLKLLKLFWISYFTNVSKLIEKYEKISMLDLLKRHGVRGIDAMQLIGFINGTSVQNMDLETCPALDFLVMLKLMMNGLHEEKTIMYEVQGGYGEIFNIYKGIVEKSGGAVILGEEVERLLFDEAGVWGIAADDKKISAGHTVFSGVPRDLKKLLEHSNLRVEFLQEFGDFTPARIVDLIILSKKKIHEADTNWLYLIIEDEPGNGGGIFYVIIEEGIHPGNEFLYHICHFPGSTRPSGQDKRIIGLIKEDIQQKFHYDFSENVIWSKSMVLDVHGSERTIEYPFSKRIGPETPFQNLYVIGDSYKAITTGTDGCAFSALQLAEKTLNRNFRLDEVL